MTFIGVPTYETKPSKNAESTYGYHLFSIIFPVNWS